MIVFLMLKMSTNEVESEYLAKNSIALIRTISFPLETPCDPNPGTSLRSMLPAFYGRSSILPCDPTAFVFRPAQIQRYLRPQGRNVKRIASGSEGSESNSVKLSEVSGKEVRM